MMSRKEPSSRKHNASAISLIGFLFLIDRETTRTHVYEKDQATDNRKGLEEVILQKVTLRMCLVDSPPVVGKHVEDA